jgi:hypothetical protein
MPKIIPRKEKTLLLFVIRDHVGSTPLANLSSTLKTDLERIWQGLSKVSEAHLLYVLHECISRPPGYSFLFLFAFLAGGSGGLQDFGLLRLHVHNATSQAASA